MVISCQMPELLQHADISHVKYQSVPNNKCTSCSSSDLPPCQQGSRAGNAAAVLGVPGSAKGYHPFGNVIPRFGNIIPQSGNVIPSFGNITMGLGRLNLGLGTLHSGLEMAP